MQTYYRPEREWDTTFWSNIPLDCKQAIKELERLKVYQCLALNYGDNDFYYAGQI